MLLGSELLSHFGSVLEDVYKFSRVHILGSLHKTFLFLKQRGLIAHDHPLSFKDRFKTLTMMEWAKCWVYNMLPVGFRMVKEIWDGSKLISFGRGCSRGKFPVPNVQFMWFDCMRI